MRKVRLSLLPAFLLAALTAGPAFAQEQVTVVRKSGERVSGRFETWNRERNTVYVRVNLGDQRSDFDGGHALRSIKLPNPMYRIEKA